MAYQVQAIFSIGLHKKDISLLQKIQSGVSTIRINKSNNMVHYTVAAQKELIEVIIPHFLKYPLLTEKQADFLLFKSIVELIINKDHITTEGFKKILSFKAVMNKGLNKELEKNFSNIRFTDRPLIVTTKISDPNWISGFRSGESCFDVKIIE